MKSKFEFWVCDLLATFEVFFPHNYLEVDVDLKGVFLVFRSTVVKHKFQIRMVTFWT
jgi:hypothetical protein